MSNFIASWLAVAAKVLETEFSRPVDLLPGGAIPANAAHFTLIAELAGDWSGSFSVTADEAALFALFAVMNDLPGQSADPAGDGPAEEDPAGQGFADVGRLNAAEVREAWQALFQRICGAAAAALAGESGHSCEA